MIKTAIDYDQKYSDTLRRVIPYLIFPQEDVRNKLVSYLEGFCQYYRERNESSFVECFGSIHTYLDELDEGGLDTFTTLNIHYMQRDLDGWQRDRMAMEMKTIDLFNRVAALEGKAPKTDREDRVSIEYTDASERGRPRPSRLIVDGYEMLEKKAVSWGNSSGVRCPAGWRGSRVSIIRMDPPGEEEQ